MKQVLLITPIMEMKEAEAWISPAQLRSVTQNWNPSSSFSGTWVINRKLRSPITLQEKEQWPQTTVFLNIIFKAPDGSSYN